MGYFNKVQLRPRLNKSLDLQISSIVAYFNYNVVSFRVGRRGVEYPNALNKPSNIPKDKLKLVKKTTIYFKPKIIVSSEVFTVPH